MTSSQTSLPAADAALGEATGLGEAAGAGRDLVAGQPSRWLDAVARRLIHARLARLRHGSIEVIDAAGRQCFGPDHAPMATLHVHDPAAYAEIAFGGSVGAGEAYMAGEWSTDDLTGLLRMMLRNRDVLDGLEGGWARLTDPLRRLAHAAARNTRSGSRRNIAAHYDLGNDFFALFLDPTMMYSCAFFEHPDMTLEQASVAKLDRICRKLDLRPGDRVVEIGTGWGGFAIHAAGRYGCQVTTTTVSREQHALATERVARAGLQDRVTILLEDYRDLKGRHDKLVSIEMIEAVGHQYFDAFFRRCADLLEPHGLMLLQSITIADRQYEAARDSVDFIKKHIFPGCCIPSVGALSASIARASDLVTVDLEDIGPHYATTLRRWHDNLAARVDAVRALGHSQAFVRMWAYYLCYCEAGFAERALGDVQMLLARPGARPPGPTWANGSTGSASRTGPRPR